MVFYRGLNGKIHRALSGAVYTYCGKKVGFMLKTNKRQPRCRHCWGL